MPLGAPGWPQQPGAGGPGFYHPAPGGPGFPPGSPYATPLRKSNTGLFLALLAGIVVLAVVAMVVLAFVFTHKSGPAVTRGPAAGAQPSGGVSAGGQPKPSDFNDSASWSLWDPLNDQSKDGQALTPAEVFGGSESHSTQDSRKNVYTVQGPGKLDTDCTQAISGDQLTTALRGYGCTQVVRGVYADSSKRLAGHVAVFNLRDVVSADQFIKDLAPAAGKGFVTPLPGQAAPLDRFGSGFTGADAGAYGHFVVVTWVGYTDGTNGDSANIDIIAPRSAVERGAKNFLFARLTRAR
ncbi:MAG: hypothetical protein JWO67_6650 [Streptosporangiaceae bacterium]|nr:hypothetical protein [Streptosporangiaceae bacterium]